MKNTRFVVPDHMFTEVEVAWWCELAWLQKDLDQLIIYIDDHVNAKKYIEILTNVVECYMNAHMPISSTYPHDNAPCHKAKLFVTKFKNWDWKSCHGLVRVLSKSYLRVLSYRSILESHQTRI